MVYCKKILTISFFLFLLVFCLLFIFSTSVFADTIEDYSSAISNAVSNITEIQNGANWCVVKCNDNYYYLLTCASYSQGLNYFANFVQNGQNYIFSCGYQYKLSTRGGTFYYRLNTNGTYSFYGEDNSSHRLNLTMPYTYFSSTDIHYENSNNIYFSASSLFVAPALYPNADSNQSTNLTSGNFIYFIVAPGSVPITDTIQLDFADLSSDNNSSPIVQEITLNRESAFFQFTNTAETEYHYVITARFLDWFQLINGKSYRAVLSYFDDNHNYHSITYDWTMSIDSSQQQIIADTTQQNIDKGIQDLNSYLNNQEFNEESIVNNIPSVTINSATDNLLDTLFDSLRTAFTSTTPLNFEFIIPNSNGQKIIIPSNYISSHLPSVIITLIQTFYWYIIARYILKDAWHIIDRMRQGTYYTGAEGDIKTEVL